VSIGADGPLWRRRLSSSEGPGRGARCEEARAGVASDQVPKGRGQRAGPGGSGSGRCPARARGGGEGRREPVRFKAPKPRFTSRPGSSVSAARVDGGLRGLLSVLSRDGAVCVSLSNTPRIALPWAFFFFFRLNLKFLFSNYH
jgi:hypothetical protein